MYFFLRFVDSISCRHRLVLFNLCNLKLNCFSLKMLKRRFLSKKHFFTAKVEGKRGRLTNDKKINVGKKNIEKHWSHRLKLYWKRGCHGRMSDRIKVMLLMNNLWITNSFFMVLIGSRKRSLDILTRTICFIKNTECQLKRRLGSLSIVVREERE